MFTPTNLRCVRVYEREPRVITQEVFALTRGLFVPLRFSSGEWLLTPLEGAVLSEVLPEFNTFSSRRIRRIRRRLQKIIHRSSEAERSHAMHAACELMRERDPRGQLIRRVWLRFQVQYQRYATLVDRSSFQSAFESCTELRRDLLVYIIATCLCTP